MSNGKLIDSIIDGYLAVKPSGTIAALLPWPKKWISCDLIEGVFHIYNKEGDTECVSLIHLPGSEYAVDPKEALQFSVSVKHPVTEQHQFRADNNEDYTMWIDTVRACGASSRTARRTLSSTTSSRSSLISRCSSTDTDTGLALVSEEIEGITRRLESLEESVYCGGSEERLSSCSPSPGDHPGDSTSSSRGLSVSGLQLEVDSLKKTLESCVSHIANERKEHRHRERVLEGEKTNLLDSVSTLKSQNDKLATELTSEQTMKYKHSLELAQQMCINAKQWENRYLRLSLQYLNLQAFVQHLDSGFLQQSSIPDYLEASHMDSVRTIAEHTECPELVGLTSKAEPFTDQLGFKTQFDTNGHLLRYMCQDRLRDTLTTRLEPTEQLTLRWTKILDKNGDSLKKSREVKELCRQGVPGGVRSRLWGAFITYRCGKLMKSKGTKYYQSLVQSPEVSPSEKQISLDLHRSFPRNIYFNSEEGTKVPVLQRVLVAFSLHNKAIGYCQGMNMIAGMLIFHLEEEMAFWGLVAILEMIMPAGYYSTDLLAARADQIIFQELVESKLPFLAGYLKSHDIDLSLFTFNWYMTLFIDSLPISTVVRIWDIFLLEGHKTLHRVSLAVVKLHEFLLMNHQDSVSIFNMFRSTARTFYDSRLIAQLAFTEFRPFPKRAELYRRHSDKLAELRTEHAENERQWRVRQQLHDTLDGETWDIVPAQATEPEPPTACILYATQHGETLWAVQSVTATNVVLLKIDLARSEVVMESGVIEAKILCCVHTLGYVLLGTSNGYVWSYHADTLAKLWTTWVMDAVLGIVVYNSQILVHLTNGSLVRFEGISESGLYSPSILDVGTSPIRAASVVRGVEREGDPTPTDAPLPDPPLHPMELCDELWCSSGSTLNFLDLKGWKARDKMALGSATTAQITTLLPYSSRLVFVAVSTRISVWDVRRKVCLAAHDCSTVFLPPPSPKSKGCAAARMLVHTLFHEPTTATLWVGTSHGHLLIYEVGRLEERAVERKEEEEEGVRNGEVGSDTESASLDPSPRLLDRLLSRTKSSGGSSGKMEASLVLVPAQDLPKQQVPVCEGLSDGKEGEEEEEEISRDSFSDHIITSPNHKSVSIEQRKRTNTYNEYDVMDDHMISGVTDLSPVHFYETFNTFESQEDLLECESAQQLSKEVEEVFEVISGGGGGSSHNALSLSTYQILSSDPISRISTSHEPDLIMTCGGSVDQDGVLVLWRPTRDTDKIRWQAEPVTITSASDTID